MLDSPFATNLSKILQIFVNIFISYEEYTKCSNRFVLKL